MPTRSSTRLALLAILAGGSYALPARAVITIGPRSIVTSADYLAGGRAQYIGRWGAFIGTPIGPRHFVTANHVGNGGGGQFFYHNGTATETTYTATFVANQDDLAVWRIADTDPSFTLWAPLYTASNETGLPLTAIGRGTDKGAEVRLPQTTGGLRGWTWGASDGQVSGGTNVVTSIFTYVGAPAGFGGDYLYFEFDQNAGPTECIYSVGDSGGAVFIQDPADSVTKLAGINSLVDGNFSYTQSGTYFPAAIFDARGFWVGSSSADGTYIDPANYPNPVPAASYATRISSRLAFLRSIVPACGSADFNCDGDIGTDADIEAFFACLAGSCPASPCRSTADFNGDGDVGTDADIEAFFRVLAGGSC